MSRSRQLVGALAMLVLAAGCERAAQAPTAAAGTASNESAPAVVTSQTPQRPSAEPAAAHESEPAPQPSPELHTWLQDERYDGPAPVDTLQARFASPPGFTRIEQDEKSFGAWLRRLPLAAAGTPVLTYRKTIRYRADDPRIAAVVAMDVSPADLQQCADTVVRLHAEWLWWRGRRDHSYRAASGMALPFERFARGERVVPEGSRLLWKPSGRADSSHRTFRQYLDTVFAWANTVSVRKQATPVAADDLRPGDFFVLPGNPGHAVLVLDLAQTADGRQVALIGQSYMPAQNAYVIRPRPAAVWFDMDRARPIDTPFWEPFPWDSLRRLPE